MLNIFDVAFIRELVGHPKLSVKSACTLADFLMKLYLRNLVFSKMLFKCISALVQRYCQSEDFQEVLVRQSREYLTAYYALTQKRNRKAQQDATILSGQKRSLIVEMLKLIIQLEETSINDKLKVIATNLRVDPRDSCRPTSTPTVDNGKLTVGCSHGKLAIIKLTFH